MEVDPLTTQVLRRMKVLERILIPDLEGIEHREGADFAIEDEGVDLGQATTMDFTGAGVTASVVASLATVSIPSAGGGGAFTLLEEQVISVPGPTLDFQNIDQGHRHLLFVTRLRMGVAAVNPVSIRLNNVVASDYAHGSAELDKTTGAEGTWGEVDPDDEIHIGDVNVSTHTSTLFGYGMVFLPMYSVSDRHKMLLFVNGLWANTDPSGERMHIEKGLGLNFNLLAAVTRVTFRESAGNSFAVGSKISMYGLG